MPDLQKALSNMRNFRVLNIIYGILFLTCFIYINFSEKNVKIKKGG